MVNSQLQTILGRNVVELTFVRRHPKLGWSNVRGLFGTTNPTLLNSEFGFQVLHFRPPLGVGMGYDYKSKGLCVVWDIFRQEYRVFGAEQVNIRKQFDVSTDQGILDFHDYFYEYIINMSEDEKLDFMGYTGDYTTIQNPSVSPQTKQTIFSRLKSGFTNFLDRFRKFFKKGK